MTIWEYRELYEKKQGKEIFNIIQKFKQCITKKSYLIGSLELESDGLCFYYYNGLFIKRESGRSFDYYNVYENLDSFVELDKELDYYNKKHKIKTNINNF